jgi:Sec-independent protein translocase protein TatA
MDSLLKKTLIKNRPKLSESSIATYLTGYKRVAKNINLPLIAPMDFSINIDKIIEYCNTLPLNKRRSTIASIISLIKIPEPGKDLQRVIERYSTELTTISDELNEEENEQEMTEKQKEAYLPWPDILEIYSRLKAQAEPLWKIKEEYITADIFEILQYYVLLSCYVLIPPRRSMDYTNFKIRNFNKEFNSKDNYMIEIKQKPYFVFNTYKNASRLGAQKFEIPLELKQIIKKWMKVNNGDYLLLNSKKKNIPANRINKMLYNIFKRNIGASLLRHSYLTHNFGSVNLADLERTTQQMGSSSINRILKYVDKSKAKEEESERDLP